MRFIPFICITALLALSIAAPHAAAQSDCSLSPSPPPGFTEQKASVGGIGINRLHEEGHGG